MSLRKILIFTSSINENSRQPIFSRSFPAVERKAKHCQNDKYIELPSDQELMNGMRFELGHTMDGVFNPRRDSCMRVEEKPVTEISSSTGMIWPIVVVEQKGVIYCCLPLVESKERPPLSQISGVTLGFSLLCGLAEFFRQNTENEMTQRRTEIYSILNIAVPLGKLVDVNIDLVVSKLSCAPSLPSQKQAAWKPSSYKGKNLINLAVTENIKAVQYNRENVMDVKEVYGSISCRADLEGIVPDITLNISSHNSPLDNLLIHPCVQSADTSSQAQTDSRPGSRRIRFTPPHEMFILCHYTAPRLPQLPVSGIYQMKMNGRTATVSVSLQLNSDIKNNMEYCELQIPFFNQGHISSLDSNVTQGNTMLSPDKSILVWNIGPRFTSKSLSISLDATVNFADGKLGSSYEDPFCKGQNSYAQLYFKISDFTHSGCSIDPKTVQVSPNTKFKLTIVEEYVSVDYKLWNIHGDVLTSQIPVTI